MKIRLPILLFVLAMLAAPLASGQQAHGPGDQERTNLPGPEHEKLAGKVGTWDVEIKMGSGRSENVFRGTARNRMIAGGRFLEIEYDAQNPKSDLKGTFIIGFDARHQRFALVAFDSTGTYFVTSQGQPGNDNKIKLTGTDDDPHMKALGYNKEFAHVLDWKSADRFAIEVWFVDTRTPARKEFKYLEYSFARKN